MQQRVVTMRSEYLFVDGFCMGQRARGETAWRLSHPLIGERLLGILVPERGYFIGQPPKIGSKLIVGESLSSEVVEIVEEPRQELAAA